LNLINASSNFDQIQLSNLWSSKFPLSFLICLSVKFPRKAMLLWPNLIMTPIIERRAAQLCQNKSSNALLTLCIIEYFPLQLSEETSFVHCAFPISESTFNKLWSCLWPETAIQVAQNALSSEWKYINQFHSMDSEKSNPYEKKVQTVMVNNSTNINNCLSSQLVEHKKDHDIWRWKSRFGFGTDTKKWWG